MSKINNILGVASLQMATPGDGIMGTVFTDFDDIEVNSIQFDGESAAEETIKTEADDAYITLNGEGTPAKMKVRLFGVALSDYPMLMGGTFSVDNWGSPKTKPNIFLSVKLTSTTIDSQYRTIEIPYGKINAKLQGNITKNGIPAIDVEITANTPISAALVEGDPYTITDV